MIGMNIQTSFLTPPFGFALFYLRGVAPPEVRTSEMYRAVIPFIVIQLIGLVPHLDLPGDGDGAGEPMITGRRPRSRRPTPPG